MSHKRGMVGLRIRVLALVFACAASQPGRAGAEEEAPPRYTGPSAVDQFAGKWQTWVVRRFEIRPPAPVHELAELQTEIAEIERLTQQRDASAEAAIARWRGSACVLWNEALRQLIRMFPSTPPEAARALALLSVAQYDTAVLSWEAKYSYVRAGPLAFSPKVRVLGDPDLPSYVSERAAISAASAEVLQYLFPQEGARSLVEDLLEEAKRVDLQSGTRFRSDIEAGIVLGKKVAEQVVALARREGQRGVEVNSSYRVSTVPGRWEPTPAGDGQVSSQPPVLPRWGLSHTWVVPTGHALRPNGPPPYGSEDWEAEIAEVHSVSKSLSASRRALARRWEAGPGTDTPAGMWNVIACELGVAQRLSEVRMAQLLAVLGVTLADAVVCCWDCKYAYDCCRPVTAIRSRVDSGWLPLFETPRFPSYPSGHATVSCAAAEVLGFMFPSSAVELNRLATEATNSRLWAGIHTRTDNEAGAALGRAVGQAVLRRVTTADWGLR